MNIELDYGKAGLVVEVPDANLMAVAALNPAPVINHSLERMQELLDRPLGTQSLHSLARSRRTACVLICDITRPVPYGVILPSVLQTLHEAGIARSSILILVATGLHRASTEAEIVEMVGPEIAAAYRIESHDARDLSSHVHLGETGGGSPVWIDRRYVEADLKLAIGLVEPHLMAGFSGGRKVICPGIAAAETIRHFHGVQILNSPLSCAGQVEGNPVHAMATEAARITGCDFIVNAALDENRQITGLFAGDMEEAWEQAVVHVRAVAEAPLPAPADIVLTSAAGYPLDATFYQSVKGLVGAMPAVRHGGTIIMAAAMQEGVGSAEFNSLLHRHRSVADLMAEIVQPDFFCIDQWQAQELARVCEHAHVVVYSDRMPSEMLTDGMVTPAATMQGAIQDALRRHGPDASITVIPRGPYVLPVVTGA